MNQSKLQVQWGRCFSEPVLRNHEVWCGLFRVDVDDRMFDTLEGVYIIWSGGSSPGYVRVGQGLIREGIVVDRLNPAVLAFQADDLFVTWAAVPAEVRDGVAQYLVHRLQPRAGDLRRDVAPIPINMPRE